MKKMLLLLTLFSAPIFADKLTSFDAITTHLDEGKSISVVVKNKLCTIIDSNEHKIPYSTIMMRPDNVLFTDNLLSFDGIKYASKTHFPQFPHGILQRGVFSLTDAGQINIIIAFFDSETNKKNPAVKDVLVECQLNEGVNIFTA